MQKDRLFKFPNAYGYEHLSAAVDLYHLSIDTKMQPYLSGNRSHRYAIASIVQAFIGLEAVINIHGYKLLFDQNSKKFIAEDPLNIQLDFFRRSWNRTVPLIDKYRFVINQHGLKVSPQIDAKLREFIIFRNWLVHGAVYTTTLLLEELEEDIFTEHIREDSVDWKAKFPNLRFNSLDSVDSTDAEKTIRIVFEAFRLILLATKESHEILYFKQGKARIYKEDGKSNLEELISGTSPELKNGE